MYLKRFEVSKLFVFLLFQICLHLLCRSSYYWNICSASFCSRLFKSLLNIANKSWCILISSGRWLNRWQQRKLEQSERSVQLGLVQLPDPLDPAFVSLLQCQLSGSLLKMYVYPSSCTILSFRVLSRLNSFFGGAGGIAIIFILNLCSIGTPSLPFINKICR